MNQIVFRNFYLPITVLTLCFIWLYYPVIAKMVLDWSKDDNYSHGFLIPFISGFLVWQRRERLSKIPTVPSDRGFFLVAGGLALFVVATIGSELFTMRFSMIIVIWALVIYIAGWEFGRATFFPIAYLVFMIPIPAIIWNKVAFPLKLFTTAMAAHPIEWLGIPVYREGNILHLSTISLEVVDACSGLRSLTSLLAISGAFALISGHSTLKKWILFLSAVPIAIFVNIIRLTCTAVLANMYGEKIVQGFLHELSGILIFVLALILFYSIHLLFQRDSLQFRYRRQDQQN